MKSGPESGRREETGARRLESLLLRLVDVGLAGAIFAVPLLMGGRQPLGHFVLVALAFWAAACWCLRQGLRGEAAWFRSPFDWLLVAAPVLIGIQLVTLPPAVIESIAGQIYKTLPLWSPESEGSASLGVWNTLTLAPAATRRSLAIVLAMVLLAAVTLQRVRRLEDVERLVRWVACSAVVVAVFGLVQYVTSNGKFFWFYQHPQFTTKAAVNGCFTNPNHFAQFLALGIGPLIWWIQTRRNGHNARRTQRPEFEWTSGSVDTRAGLLAVALAVLVFAGLMSRSRGGALVIVAAAATCLVFLYLGGRIRPQTLLAGVGVGGLVVAGLFVHGYQPVADELGDFASLSTIDQQSIRQSLWKADLQAFADYPVSGTGAGSHRDANAVYFRHESTGRLEYTHAESGYVQIAMEAGVPGAILMLAAVGLAVYCCVAPLRRLPPGAAPALAAVAASLAANFLHSLFDFVWYVPGCMVVVVILGACACRLRQFAGRPEEEHGRARWASRTVWLAAAGCLAVVGGLMLEDRLAVVRAEPAWHDYLLLERAAPRGSFTQLPPEMLQAMAGHLEETIGWLPDRGRAHARLAEVHLAMFEQGDESIVRQGGAKGIRDAALASRFESPEALREWLERAFPERWRHLEAAWRHARLAARHAPLEGEAYLFLANVPFFDGPRSPGVEGYVAQALRVRPYDGYVLFEAGREALLAGEPAKAFEHWQQSYQTGPVAQRQLEEFLAGVIPAATFVEVFRPDRAALERMSRLYAERQLPPEEQRAVLECYAAALESDARALEGQQAAHCWQRAAVVFEKLDRPDQCIRCLRRAVAADPGLFKARHTLGKRLFEMGRYAEAEENLRWCAQWDPGNDAVRKELEAAVDKRLRMGSLPEEAPRR